MLKPEWSPHNITNCVVFLGKIRYSHSTPLQLGVENGTPRIVWVPDNNAEVRMQFPAKVSAIKSGKGAWEEGGRVKSSVESPNRRYVLKKKEKEDEELLGEFECAVRKVQSLKTLHYYSLCRMNHSHLTCQRRYSTSLATCCICW